MKTAVFSFSKPSAEGVTASGRIATFLAETIGAPLVYDSSIRDMRLDVLFLVNGAFAFCKVLPDVAMAIENAKRIVWVQNDYTIAPPKPDSKGESPFRKAFVTRAKRGMKPMIFWSTVRNAADEYINWNSLTYDPLFVSPAEKAALRKGASKDLFYYGAFRQNRVKLFDQYFQAPCVPVTISSPSKEFAARYATDCGIVSVQPKILRSNFYRELASHGLGLYLEDSKSSKEFHSPANRFYEMLSAGLPMVFQPEAVPMMSVAGFDITPYVVREQGDVIKFMRKREQIAEEQRQAWHTHYASKLRIAVKAAYGRL